MAQTKEEKQAANREAVKKFYREKCIEFKVRPRIEEGEQIKQYAAVKKTSVQKLFLEAVREYMIRHPIKMETPKKEEPAEVLPKEEEKPMEEPKGEPEEESTPEVLVSPFEFHEACVFALVFPNYRFISSTKDLGASLQAMKDEIEKNGPRANRLLREYVASNGNFKVELLEVLYDISNENMTSRCSYYREKEKAKEKQQ